MRVTICFIALMIGTASLFDLQATAVARAVKGTVTGSDNRPVAGAVVTMRGALVYRRTLTAADGAFRFDAVREGTYLLRVSKAGFANSQQSIDVGEGLAVAEVVLHAGMSESIEVFSEEPLIDIGRPITGAEWRSSDFQQLPSTRDPWAVLRGTPGVLTDRINVGGAETVEHALQVNKGTTTDQSVITMDGTPITDMTETGMPPTFFDFESFDSVSVITGGSDPRIGTSGVQMRLVVKRGGDTWRGSGRFLFSNASMQGSSALPADAALYIERATSIRRINETGVEFGGPLLQDRLTIWGGYSQRHIDLVPAKADLEGTTFGDNRFLNADVKFNYHLTPRLSGSALAMRGDHTRAAEGLSALRPPETGWNESTRSTFARAEQTFIVSTRMLLNAAAAHGNFATRQDPRGGRDLDVYFDAAGAAHGSYSYFDADRPQKHAATSAAYFQKTGAVDHEIRAGIELRQADVHERLGWPGSGNYGLFDAGEITGIAVLTRPANSAYEAMYRTSYLSETLTWKNITLLMGVRYDDQQADLLPSAVPANPRFADLLPAAEFSPAGDRARWRDLAPRIGLTWAIGSSRRTLLRAARNRYTDQLGTVVAGGAHPFYDIQALIYAWRDDSRDRQIQRNELFGLLDTYRVDPAAPGAPARINRLDPALRAPYADEWSAGIEQQFGGDVVVALNGTWRKRKRLSWVAFERSHGTGDFIGAGDYVPAGTVSGRLPDGTPYAVPYYRMREVLFGSRLIPVLTNRPDYEQSYNDLELIALKRFSNGWMLRGSIWTSDWKQSVGVRAFGDPTSTLGQYGCTSCNDAIVVQNPDRRANPKSSVFINARWAYALSALSHLPFGMSAAISIFGREGYPIPYIRTVFPGDGTGFKDVLVAGVRAAKNPDVFNMDARLAKDLVIGRVTTSLALDVFNVTGKRTVLQRTHRLNHLTVFPNPANSSILELQTPRVLRIGARVSF